MDKDEYLKEKLDIMNPDKVEREKFLDIISHIESSGGKNFDHPEITSGVQAGTKAIGTYGLMPRTVQEIVKRTGVDRAIASEPPEVMKQILEQDPEREAQLANLLAERVLQRQKDLEKAAYSWFTGHNLSPQEVEKRDYKNSEYVKKFQRLRDKLGYK
jgi:hypothetical protein